MTAPEHYGEAFSKLRVASEPLWSDFTRHSFVEQLGDGSLDQSVFLHYLRQDYVFLVHFARAWALAIVKTEHHDEMMAASATVNALVSEEMQLHIKICSEAGISEADLLATPERPENLAYTRYVLEGGFSGDYLSLLSALAPCVMGYGEIGARLRTEATSETYRDWINTYGGDDYQGLCVSVGELLDKAFERRLGADYADLPIWATYSDRFNTATELEIGFWQMGLTP